MWWLGAKRAAWNNSVVRGCLSAHNLSSARGVCFENPNACKMDFLLPQFFPPWYPVGITGKKPSRSVVITQDKALGSGLCQIWACACFHLTCALFQYYPLPSALPYTYILGAYLDLMKLILFLRIKLQDADDPCHWICPQKEKISLETHPWLKGTLGFCGFLRNILIMWRKHPSIHQIKNCL